MCERAGKIIARTHCFMRQSNFRPSYFFINNTYFFRFLRTKLSFNLFKLKSFLTSQVQHFGILDYENNIKKASVVIWEDLLYFKHFMQIFVFAQIRDYHHLKQKHYTQVDSLLTFICLKFRYLKVLFYDNHKMTLHKK